MLSNPHASQVWAGEGVSRWLGELIFHMCGSCGFGGGRCQCSCGRPCFQLPLYFSKGHTTLNQTSHISTRELARLKKKTPQVCGVSLLHEN